MRRHLRAMPSLEELKQLWGTRPRGQTFIPAMLLLVAVSTAVVVLYKTLQNVGSSGPSDRKKGIKNGSLPSVKKIAKDGQPIENCSVRSRWRKLKKLEVCDQSSWQFDDSLVSTEASPDSSYVHEGKTLLIQPEDSYDSNFQAIPNKEKGCQSISNTQINATAVRSSVSEFINNDDSDMKKSISPKPPTIWCYHQPTTKGSTTLPNMRTLEIPSSSYENSVPSGHNGSSGLWKRQNPFGLIRDDYTCYVNAGLQLLMADLDFYESLEKIVDDDHNSDTLQHPATTAFVGFVRRCLQDSMNDNSPGCFRPHEVIEYIHNARPCDFRTGEQADCAEFVSTMLTEIRNEVLSDENPVKMFEGVLVTNETSIEEDVWCNHPREETFTSIQIGHGFEHFTIENCFDFFTRKEVVEGRQGPHFSQRLFKTLPSLLLVQLQPIEKKKDGTIAKINDQLITEEVLHIRKDWMVEDPSKPSTVSLPRYSLMALVYHSGPSPHSGHYTAGVKLTDQNGHTRWFFCDDQSIQESSRPKIVNAMPDNALCLILYKREESFPSDMNPKEDMKGIVNDGKSEFVEGKPSESHNILSDEELLIKNYINSLSAEDAWSEEQAGLLKWSPSCINAGLQVLSVDPRVMKYVNDGVDFWTERNRFNMPGSQAFLAFTENRRILMASPFTPSQSALIPEEIIKYISENSKLDCEPSCTEFVTAMLSVFEDELTDAFSPTKHLLTGIMMDRDDRREQPFASLALQPSSDFCQFEDCLTQFFNKVDEGAKVFFSNSRFYTLPPLLLIEMRNFREPPSKPWRVLLDQTLVVKQDWLHVSSPERTSELPRYNLRAVVYRSDDDHYTAGVKQHGKSEWYLCDDKGIVETCYLRSLEERYPMNSVHLLLYKRHSEEN